MLGKKNSASTTTSLKSKSGSALKLLSRAGSPPLSVSNGTRVPRLNADLIDGIDSSQFALKTDTLPDWSGYTIMVAGSNCPPGTATNGLGYGAEDTVAAVFGFYPYKVQFDSLLSTYRLVRDRAPLRMAACTIP